MGYDSKNVRAVIEILQCTSRPNLSEGACQKSCKKLLELLKLWAERDHVF